MFRRLEAATMIGALALLQRAVVYIIHLLQRQSL